MRRMYSVQELSEIVSVVIGQKIEDGSFDEVIAGAVDDYLTEHPVDITALEGLDISVGSLDADGLVTGGEIVEKMSGYSFTKNPDLATNGFVLTYVGVVKNGNKITFALAGTFTLNENTAVNPSLGAFTIPASIGAKLYADSLGSLDNRNISFFNSANTSVTKNIRATKTSGGDLGISLQCFGMNSTFTSGTLHSFRYECTFLLSENLAS